MTQEGLLESAMTQMMEADVERLWPDCTPEVIASILRREWCRPVSARLVCSMYQRIKRRLDRRTDQSAD